MEANIQIDAVFGFVRQFVSPDVPDHRRIALAPKNEIIKGELRIAMLVRRGAYDKVGGFDETFRAASIIEWLGRAKMRGLRSIVLDEIVASRRLHLTNGGRINAKTQDDETLAALKRVIEARRSLRETALKGVETFDEQAKQARIVRKSQCDRAPSVREPQCDYDPTRARAYSARRDDHFEWVTPSDCRDCRRIAPRAQADSGRPDSASLVTRGKSDKVQGMRLGRVGPLMHLAGTVMADDGISVIIPAYNVENFIGETVASVVTQTWPVDEILAIDDGSTDGTAAWLRDMAGKDARLRVLTSDRLGPSGARNVGLKAATRPRIAFLDGDDVWPREQGRASDAPVHRRRPACIVSELSSASANSSPAPTPAGEPGEIMANVNLGACLFRRQVFDVVGLFDERFRLCEDVDLMFRVREAGLKLVIMREVSADYRTRPGSLTQTPTKASEVQKEMSALEALQLSIGRRRNSGRALALPPFTSLIDE